MDKDQAERQRKLHERMRELGEWWERNRENQEYKNPFKKDWRR